MIRILPRPRIGPPVRDELLGLVLLVVALLDEVRAGRYARRRWEPSCGSCATATRTTK